MLSQTAWLIILALLINAAIVGVGLYLKAYLTRKGENLATREDVRALTASVEEVKSQFLLQQEREKHILARRLEEHRLSLQTELPIYREIWERMLALQAAMSELQVAYLLQGNGSEIEQRRATARAAYDRDRDAFYREMQRIEPFIAPEVYQELFRSFIVVRKVAEETHRALASGLPGREQSISDGISKTVEASRRLSDAIRTRLYSADGAKVVVAVPSKDTAAESHAGDT